jgi:hypothetical protein
MMLMSSHIFCFVHEQLCASKTKFGAGSEHTVITAYDEKHTDCTCDVAERSAQFGKIRHCIHTALIGGDAQKLRFVHICIENVLYIVLFILKITLFRVSHMLPF